MPIDWEQLALGPRETIDTTYADLRPTDLVIDKSGQAWPIAELSGEGALVLFWLCDPVTSVKMHHMVKLSTDPVKVSRLPTQADEAAKLEADFPKSGSPASGTGSAQNSAEVVDTTSTETASTTEIVGVAAELREVGVEEVDMADAVAGVEAILGGTVEAEVTAEEVDAAAAATDDAPVSLPPFADMTPLEQRSHLYLLHGLYGSDVTGRAELAAIHEQAHAQHDAGTLQSRYVPHVHEVK